LMLSAVRAQKPDTWQAADDIQTNDEHGVCQDCHTSSGR
jgi:hypothetical protein